MKRPERSVSNRTCIILNPSAKGERARHLVDRIRRALPGVHLERTTGPGHARELAARACDEGYERVVAAGGDGTVNEVVNGIAGREVTLGLLPIGTVNVFAMELGIPQAVDKAVEVIRDGEERVVDLPQVNGRHFIQLAGVGLDAQTVKETDLQFKKALGALSYVVTATQVAARKAPQLVVRPEGGKTMAGAFLLVGNGRYYGGPFPFFPKADLNDGLLDVCVFERLSHLDMLRYFQGILTGRLTTNFPDVRYFKTPVLEVEAEEDVPLEVDGELHGALPARFTVKRGGLRVLTPAAGKRAKS